MTIYMYGREAGEEMDYRRKYAALWPSHEERPDWEAGLGVSALQQAVDHVDEGVRMLRRLLCEQFPHDDRLRDQAEVELLHCKSILTYIINRS